MVVPASPGPLLPLSQVDGTRSDVDEILDDVFGHVDDDGPGATDAVLLAGGAVAIVASQVVALPAVVLFGGIAGVGLGSVLPVRSGIRQLRGKRRDSKIQTLIGHGRLLDTRHDLVSDLVAAHEQALVMSDQLSEVQGVRLRNAAHGLVTEVAMLLDGHEPDSDVEIGYTTERLDSLRSLLAAVSEAPADPAADSQRRQAAVEARVELDQVTGTAVDEAALLAEDLRIERDR